MSFAAQSVREQKINADFNLNETAKEKTLGFVHSDDERLLVPASVKYQQIQLYMNAKNSGHTQQTSAAKAGISARTARRIDSGTHRPKRGRPRDWKTRADPLDGHWEADLLPMLEREPRLEPTTLFEMLWGDNSDRIDVDLIPI